MIYDDPEDSVIIHNKAQCLICKDTIESVHRHDFVQCKCGNIFVDGGHEYLRRGVQEGWETFKELSKEVRA